MPLDVTRLALIGAQLISLGNELIEMSDSTKPPDDEVLWLARAIQGEGAALFGDNRDEVGLWIAHTALNRLNRERHPYWRDKYATIVDVVRDAFHGVARVKQPEPWAIELARQALNREEDIAGGAVFMLSGADLKRHGWSSSSAIQAFVSDGHAFYFFRLWPGG